MIIGQHIILRPPLEKDHAFLYTLRNDVELQLQLLARPRANSMAKVKDWLAARLNDEHGLFFIIANLNNDKAMGFIQLSSIDVMHRTGYLGICLGHHYHGCGYAKEALNLFEHYLTRVFHIRKIMLEVLASHKRAIALYTRTNYREVGTWQDHVYQSGSYHDVLLMEKVL